MRDLAFHDHRNRRSPSDSASIERCSSVSDVLHHQSLVSDMLLHSSSKRGSDQDPKRNLTVRNNGGPYLINKKVEKVEAIKEYVDEDTDAENQTVCSARSSSYKECQNRKLRSEVLLRKFERRRPASLDLNGQTMNVTSSSPRLGSAVKTSATARRRGAFPSPWTPTYHTASVGVQKGWSSERVPSHTSSIRSISMPYNNGKALPSKWEDAERWIVSPVAGENGLKPLVQQQKRPKSKSGPLGPHGAAESLHHHPDVKLGCSIDAASNVSRDVSRRDMATQMSPESSPYSSPRKSISSSIIAVDTQHVRSSKSDIRDVQVDDQVSLTPYVKKSRGQSPNRRSNIVDDWKDEGSEMRKSLSKVQREEAKIIAWENLQKAKADAAIRKLEMKLEKKRSSSMDRIIHKLQSAQKKAQDMRDSVLSDQPDQVAKSSHKTVSLIKTCNVRFLTGCFTCPAF